MLNAGMQRSGKGYFCVKVFSVLMVLVLENLCVVQLWSQAFFGQLRLWLSAQDWSGTSLKKLRISLSGLPY